MTNDKVWLGHKEQEAQYEAESSMSHSDPREPGSAGAVDLQFLQNFYPLIPCQLQGCRAAGLPGCRAGPSMLPLPGSSSMNPG